MKRLILLLCLIAGVAGAQTTTYTGTIKDLSLNVVTSGQVTFTLTPSVDTTIPGLGRFTPTTISCNINADGSLSGYVAGSVSGACIVASNTSISPSGTSYRICIQPYGLTPGSCFFDYAIQTTKDITTIAPTLQTGPVNYNGVPGPPLNVTGAWSSTYPYHLGDVAIGAGVAYVSLSSTNLNNAPASSPAFWNTLQSFTNLPVTSPSLNNVVWADGQTGSDEGAKITAAFATQAGTLASPTQAVKVVLSPNQIYQVSTAFSIPNQTSAPYIKYPTLDCQGSALIWNGSGDFISVLTENAADVSGSIQNCYILNGSSNTASLNGIHQYSRIGFSYINDDVYGFANGPNAAGLLIDEVAESGWGGYNEHTRIIDGIYWGSSKNLRFLEDGGTGSFARTIIRGVTLGTTVAGQYGMTVEGSGGINSAYMYNSQVELRGNIAGNTSALLLQGGGVITSSHVSLGFEGGQYLVNVADANSGIFGDMGILNGQGMANFLCASCGSDQINVFDGSSGGFLAQNVPYANSNLQQYNSKFCAISGNCVNAVRYGIANIGNSAGGWFQIYQRATSGASQEVDSAPTSGSMQVNVAACNYLGCGFGPGYGQGPTTGGTWTPSNPIEVNNGAFKVATNGGVTAPSVTTPGLVSAGSINSAGYVGIGTTNAVGQVTVGNSAADGAGAPANGIQFVDTASSTSATWSQAAIYTVGSSGYNGSLVFATDGDGVNNYNPTEKMRILPNGYVGIGTNAPTTALQVNGTITGTTKNFQIPYPGDPTKQLVHSTLEGPEIAVFYRGTAQLTNGSATIILPPYFEALTTVADRTVLLTPQFSSDTEPISQLAASSVTNGKFTVRASDTNNPAQAFNWEVKAVRSDQAALRVIIPTQQKPPAEKHSGRFRLPRFSFRY